MPPDYDGPREYRLRRDHPDLELKNGVTKEKGKYLSPPGTSNRIYFPPNCDSGWLTDLSTPIVFTEGEKKALALSRVAWHRLGDAAEKPRFLAFGLSGVWNFSGVVGKELNAKGQRQDVKGLINDFQMLDLKGRDVKILYDANVTTNDSVRRARNTLAKEMRALGAKVAVADCPEISGCNGIDDVLGAWDREGGTDAAVSKCLELLDSATDVQDEKLKQADRILEILGDIDLFHTLENEPFATIECNGHVEHHRLGSKPFRQWVSHQYYMQEGKAPSSQAVQDTVATLSGKAIFDGPTCDVFVRFASHPGKIYLDLCDPEWKYVEIDKVGWRIIEARTAPVKFRRTKGMLPLPLPTGGGSIEKLNEYLNITEDNRTLVLGWLINCFRPDFPFPILILSGEQGTAKSTAVKVLRSLVDPSITPFRSTPRHEHDLIIAASNGWIVSLDNLSVIQDWLSVALCRLSTGGGFATRTLYSDDDETIFNAKRPIVINGIGDLANRSDLLDRAILVKLEPIPKENRVAEREFWEQFEKERPFIFTGLLTAISEALRNLDSVNIVGLPRMADFAKFVVAAEPALGLESGAFLAVYDRNRQNAHSLVLEDSPLADVLRQYCDEKAVNGRHFAESILLKELLSELIKQAGDTRSSEKKFPKTSKTLRNNLERINPNLREAGIIITFLGKVGPSASKGASVSIEYIRLEPSPTSLTSESAKIPEETYDVISSIYITGEEDNRHHNPCNDVSDAGGDVPIPLVTTNITNVGTNDNGHLRTSFDASDASDVGMQVYSGNRQESLSVLTEKISDDGRPPSSAGMVTLPGRSGE